jgi:hypothetical protein
MNNNDEALKVRGALVYLMGQFGILKTASLAMEFSKNVVAESLGEAVKALGNSDGEAEQWLDETMRTISLILADASTLSCKVADAMLKRTDLTDSEREVLKKLPMALMKVGKLYIDLAGIMEAKHSTHVDLSAPEPQEEAPAEEPAPAKAKRGRRVGQTDDAPKAKRGRPKKQATAPAKAKRGRPKKQA